MRKIIPVMLIGASVCSSISPALVLAARNQDNNANSSVWEDPNSKSWGNTPSGVKTALSRVKVLGGSDVNVFNVQWLKEMSRSPSMYHLSEKDVKWANQVIKDADAKNKKVWSPNSKVIIKDSPAVKPKQEQPVLPKKELSEQKPATPKAESRPLPKPIFSADNKSPDLTPVKPVKNKNEKSSAAPSKVPEKINKPDVKIEKPIVKTVDINEDTIDKVLFAVNQLSNDIINIQKQKVYESNQEEALSNLPDVNYIKERTADLSEKAMDNTPASLPIVKNEDVNQSNEIPSLPIVVPDEKTVDVQPESKEDIPVKQNTAWMSSALSTLSLISGIMFMGLFGFYKVSSSSKRKKYF